MSPIRPVFALCALSLCAHAAQAQSTPTPVTSNLAAFNVSNPIGNVTLGDDGAIYGVASASTTIAGGLIYRAAIDGSEITTLYQIEVEDAIQPASGLTIGSDGLFYGTTRFGSSEATATTGTVFRLSQTGTGFEVIHRFQSSTGTNADLNPKNADGAYPEAELTEGADGYLYGAAVAGGDNGTGTLFKVSRDGTDFQVLHTFAADTDTSTSGLVVTVDGAAPRGQLVQGADGFIYGTASAGGANGRGVVFRIGADGTGFELLHTFSATTTDTTTNQAENVDGAAPTAGLVDGGDSFFYGVTSIGGSDGLGVLFAISPDGGTFTVLKNFDGATGARPTSELLLGSDGTLYGVTSAGGVTSSNAASTLGTIFSIDRAGTTFTRLHSFDGSVGAAPNSRLVQIGTADLIGTTVQGGRCGYGALFRYRGDGTAFEGNDRCGRSNNNNNNGGGYGGPALVLLLSLVWLRRKAA